MVVVCCCSGREVRLWRGVWPALAASSSSANRSIVGSSVFYSPSLLFIQVLCKHPRIPLTGQNNDRRKHSCEDQGGVFVLGEAYIQNNHDQHRVTFEWIQILHRPHSYSFFKASMGKCSGSQRAHPVVHKMTSGCVRMNLLHFNSYVFVSPWIRKYAVSVWSPWCHGHYCLGGEEEMVPIRTAAFFALMLHWLMEQNPP